eukprot:SAG31_NODE_3740_length_3932_cov_3.662145_2_plen_88_part_00
MGARRAPYASHNCHCHCALVVAAGHAKHAYFKNLVWCVGIRSMPHRADGARYDTARASDISAVTVAGARAGRGGAGRGAAGLSSAPG